MVCVDRIIASAACFQEPSSSAVERERESEAQVSSVKGKGSLRECKICQEEDEEKDMEAPCACNGTLKVAFFSPFLSQSLHLFFMGLFL